MWTRPDPLRRRALGPDAAGGFEAVHLGHLDVHQDDVVRQLADRFDRFEPVRGDVGAVAQRLEHEHGDLLVDGVVLGQQDPQRMAFAESGSPSWLAVVVAGVAAPRARRR